MTIAMTTATTIRIPHSTAVRVALRFGVRAGTPSAGPGPGGGPLRPPLPLPEADGSASVGGPTTVGASTSSVTVDAPPPHPRRSDTPSRTRGPSLRSGSVVAGAQPGRG